MHIYSGAQQSRVAVRTRNDVNENPTDPDADGIARLFRLTACGMNYRLVMRLSVACTVHIVRSLVTQCVTMTSPTGPRTDRMARPCCFRERQRHA